jgi:hypothetical protein
MFLTSWRIQLAHLVNLISPRGMRKAGQLLPGPSLATG